MGRAGFVGAPSDLYGSSDREQFVPGQRITGGLHVRDAPVGKRPESAQGGRGMARLHSSSRGPAKVELRWWVVTVTARSGPPLGCDHPLLLEVADHPGREADRLACRADAREPPGFVVCRWGFHGDNLPQVWQIATIGLDPAVSVCAVRSHLRLTRRDRGTRSGRPVGLRPVRRFPGDRTRSRASTHLTRRRFIRFRRFRGDKTPARAPESGQPVALRRCSSLPGP